MAFGVNAAQKNGEEGVAMLEEYRDSLEGGSDQVEKVEEVGGMTASDIDELIKEINQPSAE